MQACSVGQDFYQVDACMRRERRAALRLAVIETGRAVCFGGGGSSSSSETTSNNYDKRVAVSTGVGLSSDSSTVTVNALDGGAIARAFDLAQGVDLGNQATVSEIIGLAGQVFGRAFDSVKQQADFVNAAGAQVAKAYDNGQGNGDAIRLLTGVAIIAGTVIAIKALK